MMPAFSKAIFARVSPRCCIWSKEIGIKTVAIDGITFLNPTTRVFDCDDVSWSYEKIACPDLPPFALGVSELEKLRIYLDFQDRLLYATTADAT